MLGTVKRTGELLELFALDSPEWGVTEVAARLGVSKAGAHELLSTLVQIGLLERTPRGRYRLGWRVLTLSRIALATSVYTSAAQRVMRRVVARYGETMHLAALERAEVVYVLKTQASGGVPTAPDPPTRRARSHVTAAGKVLLAQRPFEDLERMARESGLPAWTPRTITDVATLRSQLQRVREVGYAYDEGECFEGISSVAAPIQWQGIVVAALSIVTTTQRLEQLRVEYTRAVSEAARQVSHEVAPVEGANPEVHPTASLPTPGPADFRLSGGDAAKES